MRHAPWLTFVRLTLCGGLAGCSTATQDTDVDARPAPDAPVGLRRAISLEIAPADVAVPVGETRALAVTARYDDGSRDVVTGALAWTSSAPAIATVNAEGVATGVAIGLATLAVDALDLSASREIRVTGPVLPVFRDDYGTSLTYAPFGDSTGGPSIVAESHTGTTALRLEVPAAGYTGGAFRRATPVDLSTFTAVSFWIKASKAATLNVVGLGNDASAAAYWAERTAIPLTTTWTLHVLPIPLAARLTAERGLFHLAEGGEEGAYTIWLDDVQYETAAIEELGAPSPAIATETVTTPVGTTALIHGAAITYTVGGVGRPVAISPRYFTFLSSHPAVATVAADGRVTAVAAGTTTITAKLATLDALGVTTIVVP